MRERLRARGFGRERGLDAGAVRRRRCSSGVGGVLFSLPWLRGRACGRPPVQFDAGAADPAPGLGSGAPMDTAVVTGAGRGIGRETARLLARRYAVLVTDVNEDAARETAALLGEHAWHMAQDVRDPDGHRAVAAAAAGRGPLKVG